MKDGSYHNVDGYGESRVKKGRERPSIMDDVLRCRPGGSLAFQLTANGSVDDQ
jgi:hypothetical protein